MTEIMPKNKAKEEPEIVYYLGNDGNVWSYEIAIDICGQRWRTDHKLADAEHQYLKSSLAATKKI